MDTQTTYEAKIKSEINGVLQQGVERIFINHKNNLTELQAAEIIQANTNSCLHGSAKKYTKIIVTELKKVK